MCCRLLRSPMLERERETVEDGGAGGRKDNFTADFLSRLPISDECTVDVEEDVEDCFIAAVDADESKVCTETVWNMAESNDEVLSRVKHLARGNVTACRTFFMCCRLLRSPVLEGERETVEDGGAGGRDSSSFCFRI
ncbi:hypothetical protein NDU88_005972 [Pleurodeles waltl]|uniref:Uncharacterized protein n=1 Tax=Pleurodeles waltl TaxID=8319 RepID=A0AAV7SN70_PLEWA|nr:hypothetical protein NDU88_005972 [Pleurodeles waltl]